MPLRFILVAVATGIALWILLIVAVAVLAANPDMIALALLIFALLYLVTMRTR